MKVSKFWKLTFGGGLVLVALIAVLLWKNLPSPREEKPVFKPPLKGTEILLEATQRVNSIGRGGTWEKKKEQRGIWALDPDTGKIRLLIPDGEHPIWEPQHNYFAYRKGDNIFITPRSGAYEERVMWIGERWHSTLTFPFDLLEPVGWIPNHGVLLFLGPSKQLVRSPGSIECQGDSTPSFQGISAARLIPLKTHLEALKYRSRRWSAYAWHLDTSKAFPFHHCGNPSASPDGKHIVFEVFRYAPGIGKLSSKIAIAEIKWMEKKSRPAELENVRRLTQLPEDLLEVNPRWSPDGKMIAFDVIDPKDASRTPHVIRIDGTGLKGWKLSRDDLGREHIRLQDGLTKTEHEDEVRVLDWLADGRLVLVQAKPASIIALTDRLVDMVWVVDLQHRHPPLRIQRPKDVFFAPYIKHYALLALSPTRRQLAWIDSLAYPTRSIVADEILIFDIPAPEDREALLISKADIADLKYRPRITFLSSFEDLKVMVEWEVDWISW